MTVEFREFACCHKGCSAMIVLHRDVEEKYRRTHEWFFCPAGHSQHFSGKTAEQKRIAELEERLLRQQEVAARHARDLSRMVDEALTCPWPWCVRSGYHYGSQRTFIQHLHKHHGLPVQVDPREEAEAS